MKVGYNQWGRGVSRSRHGEDGQCGRFGIGRRSNNIRGKRIPSNSRGQAVRMLGRGGRGIVLCNGRVNSPPPCRNDR